MISFSQQNFKNGIVEEEFIFDKAPFPSCHAATVAITSDGPVAAWFGGTHEGQPDVGIWFSRKINGQWSIPIEVANGIINDTLRYPCWNPVLFYAPDKKLFLFYKIGPNPSSWEGYMRISADNGLTWSKQIKLPYGFIGPVKNKPVLLGYNKLICPSSTENRGWNIHFEFTFDFGKNWLKTQDIKKSFKEIQVIQPTILVHSPDTLQALCRSKNRAIFESWSYDGGFSWNPLNKTSLPNNNSGIDGVTLADGRFLLVYNHSKRLRTPLNVAVSYDGIHWYAALILENSKGRYSYPSVILDNEGMVHIVYAWRRERIKYVKVDPSQLVLEPIVDGKWPD
ncbi:MAG: exo-alpha-sialidase [Candidatus Marinimicrobia bacterium]|nr:exo-alpha-sialidase [Candidatus Neomarinimicrobiota bacterium]